MKVRRFIVGCRSRRQLVRLARHPPAHAAFCYDVEVNVNGGAVVDQQAASRHPGFPGSHGPLRPK